MKGLVVTGGLVFSFAVATLIEELVFGQIFRMVFGKIPFDLFIIHDAREVLDRDT